tara:strand:- start:2343 stop:3062 length:720 start_codon:yes stop_codon:yes gene_type:complete
MHQLEKNIKGITLLEILVVIAIIGVISGFSYPSISDWRSTRVIKDEVQKTASLFQNINAQVRRGQYSYVQVEVSVLPELIVLTSKGMQTSSFSSLINSDWWSDNRTLRCQTENTVNLGDGDIDYWNHIGGDDLDRVEVNQITLTKTTTDLADGIHAICFSKTGKYHSGENGLDGEIYLTLCKRTAIFPKCSISGTSPFGPANTDLELVHQVNWTRFGEITVDKWRNSTATKAGAWVLQY